MPFRNGLNYNILTKQYEIEENGIMYAMQLEETRSLKKYYDSLEEWYSKLDNETNKKVVRTGNVSKDENDFYPDVM